RCALVSTGPRSLTATTSMSLRPDSRIARTILRPIRPNPLMATLTAMAQLQLSCGASSRPFLQPVQRRLGGALGGNSEMPVQIRIGSAGAEGIHADEDAVAADDRIPALAHARLDADAHARIAEYGRPVAAALRSEQLHSGHRD